MRVVPPSLDATGRRARLRKTKGGRALLRALVLLVGALFVGLGLVLVVLPGPLTIPPILLGVYIWSTEFDWAERLRERAVRSAQEAWEQVKRRPLISAVATGGGLIAVIAGFFVVRRYGVAGMVDRALGVLG